MHGIFLGRGPELRRGAKVEGARIIDFAPTILQSFGAEIPSDMDGRVLEEIFTEEFLRATPVRISSTGFAESEKSGAMTDEESEEIRERLRGWGYLG
jgi:hypothetical protein